MRSYLNVLVGICMAALLCAAGCRSNSGLSASQIQSAQVLLDEALAGDKEGNAAEAFAKVDAAITQGGLNPDQLCEAYLLRARCYSADGKLDEALADLELADQGSPNSSMRHYSRGVYFAAKGDAAKAKSEFATARKLNPALKLPQK